MLFIILIALMAFGEANAINREDVIEQECVRAYESAKRMSRTNKLQRAAVLTTVGTSIGYLAYRLLSYKPETDKETGTLLYPSFSTLGWWYKIGILSRDFFIAMACADGGIICTRSFLKSFFHDDDLAWFIATHANIYNTHKQLAKLEGDEKFEDVYIDASRRMYLQELNKELIAIDGFMRYKIEKMLTTDTTYGRLLESRLKHAINQIVYILSNQTTRNIPNEWDDIESICAHFQQWERRNTATKEFHD